MRVSGVLNELKRSERMVERNLIRTHSLSREVAARRLSPQSVGCGARTDGRGGRRCAEMGGWLGLRESDEQAILDGLDDVPVEVLGCPCEQARVRIESASAFRQIVSASAFRQIESASAFRQSIETASAFRQSGASSV